MRVLLVEDDQATSRSIELMLKQEGFVCDTTDMGEDGLEIGKLYDYDIIILDLMLPDMDGYEVLRRFRAGRIKTPILILSGLTELDAKIKGLGFGADDYLTKPFSPQELVLRVGAILRRLAGSSEPADVLQFGPIRVDRSAHRVSVNEHEVELTPTEYKLLLTLAERRGRVQARSHLLETVWDAAPDIQTRTVDMHIQRLRTKLHPAGDLIETVRGFGYRIKGGKES